MPQDGLPWPYLICPEKRLFFMSDAIQKRVLHNVQEMGKKISDGGEAALRGP